MNTTRTTSVKLSVEVITLPVSDVERALRFCRPGRFHAQRRLSPNYAFPRRAAHSAGLQLLDTDRSGAVGSVRNLYLVVPTLKLRGAACSKRHRSLYRNRVNRQRPHSALAYRSPDEYETALGRVSEVTSPPEVSVIETCY